MDTPHFHASGGNCGIGSLLESGKYSDLVINCKGRSFKVHRAILCPQSEVITKECDINMREKNTGVIHHEEYDPDTMERMLSFAYTGKYVVECPDQLSTGDAPAKDEPEEDAATPEPEAPNDEPVQDELEEDDAIPEPEAPNDEPVQDELEEDDAFPEPEAPNDELPAPRADDEETCSTTESPYGLFATEKWIAHARVYGLADYYDMPHLRFYALERFKNVTENVDNSDDLEDFIDVVEEVCKRTVREHDPLRGLVHEIVLLHAPILACNGSFITALGEREKLQDFAADMFGNLGRHMIAKTAESDARTDTLRARAKDLEVALDAAEESYNHTEGVMDRLVRSLKALPEYCRSTGCDRVMAPFEFERHGQGDWLLRCGRKGCKCKLNF